MRPARQVITRSPHRSVGAVVAPWLDCEPIAHESDHEKSFLEVAVCCPVLARVRAQPFELKYTLDDRERSHIPDYLLTFKDGQGAVVEVKSARFVDEHRPKFDAVAPLLLGRGLPYFVVSHLPPGCPTVQMAALWRRYSRTSSDAALAGRALTMARGASTSVEQMQRAGIPIAVVYHLLGRGLLLSADGFSLTPETRLLPFMNEELLDERVYFERWIGCPPWGSNLAV